MFTRNGYWIKRDISGEVLCVLRVENEYDMSRYEDGEWVSTDTNFELGMSDDWDKVTEDEVYSILDSKE